FDGFGDILKPEGSIGGGSAAVNASPAAAPLGTATQAVPATSQPTKLISGDLDMSLSSLVDNLNIKGPVAQKGQWSSPKTQAKTGGAGWTPAAPTSAMGGYRSPMPGQQMAAPGVQTGQWNPGMQMPGTFPQQPVQGMGMPVGVMPGGFPAGTQPPAQPSQPTQPSNFDPFGAL
ncbi:hypothetical protein SK128_027894, partial [Halocaridina rubra]